MNNTRTEDFESLLSRAVEIYSDCEAKAFLKMQTEAKLSPALKRKLLYIVRTGKREEPARPVGVSPKKALKVAAMVAALLLAGALTVSAVVPEVRERVWGALVEWYEDHFTIELPVGNLPADPPKSIEQTVAPTWMPEGYTVEEETGEKYAYRTYYDANGTVAATFIQNLIAESDMTFDNMDAKVSDVTIGEYDGVLVSYSPTEFALVWVDEQYRYELGSYTLTYEDALKMAESLSTAK